MINSNEIFEKNPHIFILTEFVKALGWLDLKLILEEKYYVYASPFFSHQNGICIGIREECGIEVMGLGSEIRNLSSCLNTPDFYEVKVRVNSQIISIIGTRIKIDCRKAQSEDEEVQLSEHRQRFEQYTSLIKYIAQLDNGVIALGDFNNSRILFDENETDEEVINEFYDDKVSIEHSEQFRSDGKEIVAGVPDHAILRAEIKICK